MKHTQVSRFSRQPAPDSLSQKLPTVMTKPAGLSQSMQRSSSVQEKYSAAISKAIEAKNAVGENSSVRLPADEIPTDTP